MANVDHQNLTGAAAVHPAAYVQAADPGAVGANKFWVDTSTVAPYQLKKRNTSNTGWENVGIAAESSMFNDAEGNPTDVVGTGVADGTSAFAARRDHIHELGIITTRGDLIRGGASGVPERVAIGGLGTVLTSDGTDVGWATPTGGGGGATGSGGSGAIVPIQTIGPLTSAAASMTFSVPTSGFRNLRLMFIGRSDQTSSALNVYMEFNSDTTAANYSHRYDGNANGSGGVGGAATPVIGWIPGTSSGANKPGHILVSIPNHAGTTFHKVSSSIFSNFGASNGDPNQLSHFWNNTAAITQIRLLPLSGNFIAGSYACLYGEMDTQGPLIAPASNLLYETTLSSATATITTPALSQAYRDLKVVIVGRTDAASTNERLIQMRFNNDTSASYDRQSLTGTTAAASAGEDVGQTSVTVGWLPGATSAAGILSTLIIDIPNYSLGQFHISTCLNSHELSTGAGARRTSLFSGFWRSATPISSIQFFPATSGNFVTGTMIRIYGEPVSAAGESIGTGTSLTRATNQTLNNNTLTAVKWPTEESDADEQHYTSEAALSAGTVAKTAGSATLTGTSTVFTTDLAVGQVISVPGTSTEKRVVTAIASNTSLTVNAPYFASASGQTCTRLNSPIVFRQPGFYEIRAGVFFASNSTGIRALQLVKNDDDGSGGLGEMLGYVTQPAVGSSTGTGIQIERARQFAQWDFIEVFALQDSGSTLDIAQGAQTFFTSNARPSIYVRPTSTTTSSALFKETKLRGSGNKTTTSTTFVAVDNTNLPALSLTLTVGDIVRCTLRGMFNIGATNMYFDWQVVRPTLGAIRVNVNAVSGATGFVGSNTQAPAVETTYTATENGVHTFQPFWRVTGGTATLYNNSATSSEDITVLHTVEKVGIIGSVAPAVPYVNVQDQKAQNTAGGTGSAATWNTRTLNTLHANTDGTAIVESNTIILQAGTWRCLAFAPAVNCGRHQARLFNNGASATLLTGTSEFSNDANQVTKSIIAGRFTLVTAAALEIQHNIQTANTNHFGTASNFTTEVYTVAEFWKES